MRARLMTPILVQEAGWVGVYALPLARYNARGRRRHADGWKLIHAAVREFMRIGGPRDTADRARTGRSESVPLYIDGPSIKTLGSGGKKP